MLNLYMVVYGRFTSISFIGEISSPLVLFVMVCVSEITLKYNWLSLSLECEFLYFSMLTAQCLTDSNHSISTYLSYQKA